MRTLCAACEIRFGRHQNRNAIFFCRLNFITN
nr:MAG TPA: hypothetical protein [Caudoviricetes sp.]